MLLSTFIILCPTLVYSQLQRNIFVENKEDCNTHICYPKCCPKGMYRNSTDDYDECQSDHRTLDLENIHIYSGSGASNTEDKRDFYILPDMYQQTFINNENFRSIAVFNLLKDGTLNVTVDGNSQIIGSEHYCFDYNLAEAEGPELQYWIELGVQTVPSRTVEPAVMLVSSVFLALVLIVYGLLPELRNLGGKILMAYVFCLFSAYTSIPVVEMGLIKEEMCIVLAAFIYYFMLASCCWVNVMSYDVFWTFRGYAKARKIHRRGENFKFLMYCLYAFGVPLAMTIMMVVLNSIDGSHVPWFISPGIPEPTCFLGETPKLYYLYIPMFIMILCNWFFFGLTVYNIKRKSKGTSVLKSSVTGSATSRNYQRNRFMIYLKLSVILGINLIIEVMSIVKKHVIWNYLSWYNMIIGVIIFVLFVFKRKVYEALKKKFSSKSTPNRSNSVSSGLESNTATSNPDP